MSACYLHRFQTGPYTHGKDRRLIRFDGYKIVGNDCHHVVIDGEMLEASRPPINHPQSVSFSTSQPELGQTCVARARGAIRHQRTVGKHFSVDQVIVRTCSETGGIVPGDCRGINKQIGNANWIGFLPPSTIVL